MGTDVEASCAPPSHLPIATVASSPAVKTSAPPVTASAPFAKASAPAETPSAPAVSGPTALNWNCDQSHRIEHSDLTFDYCVARNDARPGRHRHRAGTNTQATPGRTSPAAAGRTVWPAGADHRSHSR